MNKLKIAYIIPRFHPFKGGAEVNIEALATKAAKDGHEVVVLTTNVKFRDEKPPKEEVYENIKILRMNAWNKALYAGFYPQLLNHLKKNEYDVIHTSGIGFLWREMCLRITKKNHPNTKYICTPHGPFMALEGGKSVKSIIKKAYTSQLRKFLNKLYDVIIQVNPTQENWLLEEYGIPKNKVVLIPNGIESNYIERELFTEKFRDKTVITFVGRLANYKGAHRVIEALAKISRRDPNLAFEFWIMGRSQGDYTEFLQKLIKDNSLEDKIKIIFSPTDEQRDDVLIKHSQVHILPSKWEATGIVLLEAMAKGNAIVTTFQNEAHEMLINQGENGYVYNYDDEAALVKILTELITNSELRQSMAQRNLEKAREFSWDSTYKKYKQLLTDLTENK